MSKRSKQVSALRRRYKLKAVELLGGKCSICGYSKSIRALEFHHVNPRTKAFGIGKAGVTRSWQSIVEELKKCILLCSNCHAEQEDILFTGSSKVERLPVKETDVGSSPTR